MLAEVYALDDQMWNAQRIGVAEVEPECGEHFCDGCGDCLACYGEGWGDHSCNFVLYLPRPEAEALVAAYRAKQEAKESDKR